MLKNFLLALWASVIGGNWKSKAYGACAAMSVMHLLSGRFMWALFTFFGGFALAVWEYLDQKK